MAIIYETIQTCIIGLTANQTVMGVCLQKLTVLLESPNQNLKYLGLVALSEIMKTMPRGAHVHRDLVLTCIEDEDETIRKRALTILMQMVDKNNLSFIVDKLKHHMNIAEKHYRDELIEKIVQVCSQHKYKNISDFEWYLALLMELTQIRDSCFGKLISGQLMDVCVRVTVMRPIAALSLVDLLEDIALIEEQGPGRMSESLFASAYIVGEYRQFSKDPSRLVCAMVVTPQAHGLQPHIISAYLTSVFKLLTSEIQKKESTVCCEIVSENLPKFMASTHIEVQERACFIHQYLELWKKVKGTSDEAGFIESTSKMFIEPLNPVSPEAQTRVPIPEGLDLDAWISEPLPALPPTPEEMDALHPPSPTRVASFPPRVRGRRGGLMAARGARGARRGGAGPPPIRQAGPQTSSTNPAQAGVPSRGRPLRGRVSRVRGAGAPRATQPPRKDTRADAVSVAATTTPTPNENPTIKESTAVTPPQEPTPQPSAAPEAKATPEAETPTPAPAPAVTSTETN